MSLLTFTLRSDCAVRWYEIGHSNLRRSGADVDACFVLEADVRSVHLRVFAEVLKFLRLIGRRRFTVPSGIRM